MAYLALQPEPMHVKVGFSNQPLSTSLNFRLAILKLSRLVHPNRVGGGLNRFSLHGRFHSCSVVLIGASGAVASRIGNVKDVNRSIVDSVPVISDYVLTAALYLGLLLLLANYSALSVRAPLLQLSLERFRITMHFVKAVRM